MANTVVAKSDVYFWTIDVFAPYLNIIKDIFNMFYAFCIIV